MSRPAAPALTVRYEGSERTFAAGHDVVVGRDLRADVRIAHPLISRAHLVLRFDQGRWMAIDNGSLNGMFVNNRRVNAVDLNDGTLINIGNPDGPEISFDLGHHTGNIGRPPPTASVPVAGRTGGYPSQQQPAYPNTGNSWNQVPQSTPSTSRPQTNYPSTAHPPTYPTSTRPSPGYPPSTSQPIPPPPPQPPSSGNMPTQMGPMAVPPTPKSGGDGNLATSMLKILRPGRPADVPTGSTKIGRATDNDIVIPDVLASRHHATLIPSPGGTEILDNRSINGTFVNGSRVDSAILKDGDVVTIGNIDLIFTGGTLARRNESDVA